MKEKISPVELSKEAGVRPQVIYNLIRQGYIKASKEEVVVERFVITKEEAERYLQKRIARLSK